MAAIRKFYMIISSKPHNLVQANLIHKLFFYNKFTVFLYMFLALLCSSWGGQIVLIHVQYLVSSLSVVDRPVHRLREESSLNLRNGRSPWESDDTICCINIIWPPDDEHNNARNMYRNTINVLQKQEFVH
jgi:hypothetical protein